MIAFNTANCIYAIRYDYARLANRNFPGLTMPQEKPSLPNRLSAVLRYGLAVLLVAIALGIGLILGNLHAQGVQFPIFLIAIAITVWYAGTGPAIVALVLSTLAFNYYFTEPFYSFYITRGDLPYYAVFILFALLITWFTTLRRQVELNLLQSRDELQREVAIRTQHANLLNLTHDSIFVRDMSDVITDWNRGAHELFGWTEEQAVGRNARELLRTSFPTPFDQIYAELLRSGRWEGELEKMKADGNRVVVSSRWSLQRDEQGNPLAILDTANDVTQRKLREEEIRALNRELGKRTIDLESSNCRTCAGNPPKMEVLPII